MKYPLKSNVILIINYVIFNFTFIINNNILEFVDSEPKKEKQKHVILSKDKKTFVILGFCSSWGETSWFYKLKNQLRKSNMKFGDCSYKQKVKCVLNKKKKN